MVLNASCFHAPIKGSTKAAAKQSLLWRPPTAPSLIWVYGNRKHWNPSNWILVQSQICLIWVQDLNGWIQMLPISSHLYASYLLPHVFLFGNTLLWRFLLFLENIDYIFDDESNSIKSSITCSYLVLQSYIFFHYISLYFYAHICKFFFI